MTNTESQINLTGSEKAKHYNRIKRRIGYAELAIGLIYLIAILFTGLTFTLRDLAVSLASAPVWWVMIYFLIIASVYEFMIFPLTLTSGFLVEKKFGLLKQNGLGWFLDYLKASLLGVVLTGAGLELIYFLMRVSPKSWWILAGAGFAVIFVLMAQLAPVLILPLFYKFTPLADGELKEKLELICEKAGTKIRGVYIWGLAEKTNKVNAALMGWGLTRRVVLSDNMVSSFAPSEVEVILAHELGHQKLHHLPILFAVQTIMVFAAFGICDLAYRFAGSRLGLLALDDIAGLPILVLVFILAGIITMPLVNVISRKLERDADAYALELTGLAGSFVSSMERLKALNLAESSPSPLVEFLFHSHPSPAKRIVSAKLFNTRLRENS